MYHTQAIIKAFPYGFKESHLRRDTGEQYNLHTNILPTDKA